MGKGSTSDVGVQVLGPFKGQLISESFEQVLAIRMCRMKLKDAATLLVFQSFECMLSNPDIVLLKSGHVLRGFAPIRGMS